MIEESANFRAAAQTGRLAFLNTGSGTAAIQVFGGDRAESVGDPPGSPMLASIPLSNPAGSVVAGALILAAADTGFIAASGAATWARVVNRNGDVAFDMDAGESDAECILSTAALFAGGSLVLISAVLG